MSGLATWEHHVESFDSDAWVNREIEGVDLAGTVTAVATIRATMPEGKRYGDPPPSRFEYALVWALTDSLSGQDWHWLAGGTLRHDRAKAVARISSPIGTRMRLELLPRVIAFEYDTSRDHTNAEGWARLWEPMSLQRPSGVHVHLAVRSI